jgi:putative two-component system hydrogenase maturation factor HypX/HoxX
MRRRRLSSWRCAADLVWARAGVILNPHYKGMGNLYGSEYWTYLLPRRVGPERAQAITQNRLPIGAPRGGGAGPHRRLLRRRRAGLRVAERAAQANWRRGPTSRDAEEKRAARARDEAVKPLAKPTAQEELERMQLNFYGFDPSYHVARYHFVHRRRTRGRRSIWRGTASIG